MAIQKNVIQRWVQALRSGQYSQCRKVLHNKTTNGYCCLGVLCDLFAQEKHLDAERDVFYRARDYDQTLPSEVAEWAGLESKNPMVAYSTERGERISLTRLNDGGPWLEVAPLDFLKIADLIEAEWLP